MNIDLIEEALKRTQNIYSKTKNLRSKYKGLKDEWQVIIDEFSEFFPQNDPEWNLTADKKPNIGDYVITIGPDAQTDTTYEFNVLVFKGDAAALDKYWFKLPPLLKETTSE